MADTISEYVIALGYNIDELGLNRFNVTIAAAAKSFGALGAMVATTTVSIEAAVTRIARQFEGLYYASQRTGETVAGLQAVGFAARQVGVSSEAALGAIENFARAVRLNPGVQGFLRGMGIGPGSPIQQLQEFIKTTNEGNYFVRARQATEILGMDERTFRMLTLEGGFERFTREQENFIRRQKEAGVDAGKLAVQSTEFSRAWNRLQSDASIFGEILAKSLMPILQRVVVWLDAIVQKINNLLGDKGRSAIAADKLSYYMTSIGHSVGVVSDEEYKAEMDRLAALNNDAGSASRSHAFVQRRMARGDTGSGGGNAASVMRYFQGKGYSPAAAAAIAANVQSESGGNPESFNPAGGGQGAYGLFQWRGDRLAGLRSRYGAHPSAGQQMDYAAWELQNSESATGRMLRGPMGDAATLGTMFSRDFERHGNAGEDAARGRLAERLVVQNSTTINVGAGSTAGATAQAVAGEQGRVNGDFVRDLQGAMR